MNEILSGLLRPLRWGLLWLLVGLSHAAAEVPDDIAQLVRARGHALLIGVSEYKTGWDQLPSVKNDLNDLKAGLKPYFETVDTVESPTADELRSKIREFLLDKWNNADERLFIYYSGHGFTDFNQNARQSNGYITGSNTPVYSLTDGKAIKNAVSFFDIDAWSRQTKAKQVLMVFDSCFSGSLFQTKTTVIEPSRKDLAGVRRMLGQPIRYYITAGRQNEQVTADGTFAKLLLRGLRGDADVYHEGIISADDLGIYLKHEVSRVTEGSQTPQFNSIANAALSEGQFFFLTTPVPPLPAPPPVRAAVSPTIPAPQLPSLPSPAPAPLLLRRLTGHQDEVRAIAFSPNGQTLASASNDYTVKFWDVANGRLLRSLTVSKYPSLPEFLVWSRDGKIVAWGDTTNIQLWDFKNSRLLYKLDYSDPNGETKKFGLVSIAISQDGGTLASGLSDGTIKFWDVASGRLLRTLPGHAEDYPGGREIAFSPNGRTLAAVVNKTIKLWDVTSGQLLHTLTGHRDYVLSVTFSPDGQMVASSAGGHDLTVKLWDTGNGRILRTLAGHAEEANSITISPDGRTLASANWDGTIKFWDVANGQLLHTLISKSYHVLRVAFSPDGHTLASAGTYENVIKIWNVSNMREASK